MARTKKTNAPASPGSLLRAGRLEHDWDAANVAQVLRLSSWQLEALENDDYANLPGETYVTGYWRNYAALLGISIDDSIAAHKKNLQDKSADDTQQPRSRRLFGGEPSMHRLGVAFTLLSVIFLLGIWYWQSPPSESALQDAWQDAAPADESAVETYSAAPESALPEPNFAGDTTPWSAPESLDADDSRASFDANENVSADDAYDLIPRAADDTDAADQLVLEVNAESWLEVHDDSGKRLLYQTVAAGERLTLTGAPPFAVFVGNAGGVAVRYRGEVVPVTVRAGDLFARFTVGSAQ